MNEINDLIKETSESLPLPFCLRKTKQEGNSYEQGRRLSPDIDSVGTLTPEFQPRNCENEMFVVDKLPT